MMLRHTPAFVLAALLLASAAFAMRSDSPPPPPPNRPDLPGASRPGNGAMTPRQEAELSYGLAYEEVGKGDQDLADGKEKNAEKRFRRALERCEKAVALDERYHEAWNLLGYTHRRLRDYGKAVQAYERSLAIKPDYAPAREYLGQAWLETGEVSKARVQLVWLERLGAAAEAKSLKISLDAWAAAHPDSSARAMPAARADSSGARSGGH